MKTAPVRAFEAWQAVAQRNAAAPCANPALPTAATAEKRIEHERRGFFYVAAGAIPAIRLGPVDKP